jgi:hypothetical protein
MRRFRRAGAALAGRIAASVVAPVTVALLALAVAALAGVALEPGSPLAATCAGAGPNHAALVVEHADGSVVTRCVAFESASITGEQLLDSSGVAWSGETFGGYGRAVCAIDSEPPRYATCPGSDSYWAIFDSTGGGKWQLSAVGISSLKLADGDAEGLRYVPSAGDPAPPQPAAAGVCSGTVASGGGGAAAETSAAGAAPVTAAPHERGSADTAPSGGIDLGWIAAALVGVGLGGLALLRLLAARRRST